MPTRQRSWRINPTPWIEHQIESLSRREGRSLSNMMLKLLTEALEQRRQAQTRPADIDRLVALLKAPANAESAS